MVGGLARGGLARLLLVPSGPSAPCPRPASSLVLASKLNQVTTITMNNPGKYNAWDMALCNQLVERFEEAAQDDDTKVVIYTGAGKYHCAGGSLAEFLGKKTPRQLQRIIRVNNERMFNVFIEFPKPIIAAVNGPGIGSGVTAPVLCDTILASHTATFLTPFARLGVGPEGAASVHFERVFGEEVARRLLVDCWKPSAEEAREVGMVAEVITPDKLIARAQELGEEWVSRRRPRTLRGGSSVQELKAANARESMDLGRAFVSSQFLEIQVPGHLLLGNLSTWPPGHLVTCCLVTCPPGHLALQHGVGS